MSRRSGVAFRLLLTLAIIVPYGRLLLGDSVLLTQDLGSSDGWNYEFPVRVELGRLLAEGELPLWTPRIAGGFPLLHGSAGAVDPLSLLLFTALPPAAALDAMLLAILLIAGHGACSLASRLGAGRAGAFLAGAAFAHSGYLTCHLKQMCLVATVAWLPFGLALVDAATAPPRAASDGRSEGSSARRVRALGLLGTVFALQVLAGFVQLAYISALTYGAFAVGRLLAHPRPVAGGHSWSWRTVILGGVVLALGLGAAVGAPAVLPLAELAAMGGRMGGRSFAQSVGWPFQPRDLLMFLSPSASGTLADGTYHGTGLFWEDYAYVGVVTVLLAVYACARGRRRPEVLTLAAITLVALLLALGPATPAYRIAFELIPGIRLFRFPTRFLVVVDLGLAVLAALGLAMAARDLQGLFDRRGRTPPRAMLVACLVAAFTAVEVPLSNLKQNAFAHAETWLAPPVTARWLAERQRADVAAGPYRIYTPMHMDIHRLVFAHARGWSNLELWYQLRDLLQPNSNLFWGLDTPDAYLNVAPDYYTALWGGSDSGAMLVRPEVRVDASVLRAHPRYAALLAMANVRFVVAPWATTSIPGLRPTLKTDYATIYEVEGALPRAYLASRAVPATSDAEAADLLLRDDFWPGRDVILHDAPAGAAAPAAAGDAPGTAGSARLVEHHPRRVVIEVDARRPAHLVLSETYFPGWTADVDGASAPILRANLTYRAVAVDAGRHVVTFRFDPPVVWRSFKISAVALGVLMAVFIGLSRFLTRRQPEMPLACSPGADGDPLG